MALRACSSAGSDPARPAPALLAPVLALVAACGAESRAAVAHHEGGALRSEAREVRTQRGDWVRSGPFRSYYADGALESEGAYVDGLEHGPWTYWLPGGERSSEGSWERGEREGLWTFYQDGEQPLAAGRFRADREQGPWRTWYPSGALESEGSYVDGREEGVWVHRLESGAVDETRTGVYEAGRRVASWIVEGRRERSFASGTTREVAELRHGVLHGRCTTFHENGRKASEGRYELGLRVGPWTFWEESGAVDEVRTGEYVASAKQPAGRSEP